MRMLIFTLILMVSLICGAASPSLAIMDPWDAMPAPPGFYMITYPYFIYANDYLDKDGHRLTSDLDLYSSGIVLRPCWYSLIKQRWPLALNAILPIGRVEANNMVSGEVESDTGLGDLTLAAAIWTEPLTFFGGTSYFAYMQYVDVPVGSYDKEKFINMGTNQWDVRPEIIYIGVYGPWVIQASVFYNFRFKNRDTDIKPGNEFWLATSVGHSIAKNLYVNLHVEAIWGKDAEFKGHTIEDSAIKEFIVGPSIDFSVGSWAVVLKYLADIDGENIPKCRTVWCRIVHSF